MKDSDSRIKSLLLIKIVQHDIHLRLECKGSTTDYDGVFAVKKYSKVSLKKSKISPIMDNFHTIIDITKGGVIDKAGSFVWWMADLGIFNNGAWWSLKEDYYNKYKPLLDKIPMFSGGARFRQTDLYKNAGEDPNIIDILQLIWLDMISDKYELQREVCSELKSQIEARLIMNLGVTQEEINRIYAPTSEIISTELTDNDLDMLSSTIAGIDLSTGEVLEGKTPED